MDTEIIHNLLQVRHIRTRTVPRDLGVAAAAVTNPADLEVAAHGIKIEANLVVAAVAMGADKVCFIWQK